MTTSIDLFKKLRPARARSWRPVLWSAGLVSILLACASVPFAGAAASTSNGLKQARAIAAQYEKADPSWRPETPPLTKKEVSTVKGKSVWAILIGESIPSVQVTLAGLKAGFAAVGINAHFCDAMLTPTGAAACITEALNSKANLIMTEAIPTSWDQTGFNDIRAQGVALLYTAEPALTANGKETSKLAYVGTNGTSTVPTGKLEADWVIANSDGKAHSLVIEDTDSVDTTSVLTQGWDPQMREYCPACTTTVVKVETTEFANIPALVSTALAQNPSINYVVPALNAETQLALQGVRTAGRYSSVIGVTGSGNAQSMIQAHNFIEADVDSSTWLGAFQDVDQAIRMLIGKPAPPSQEEAPFRIFTAKNLAGVTIPAGNNDLPLYGINGSVEAIYLRLWGLG